MVFLVLQSDSVQVNEITVHLPVTWGWVPTTQCQHLHTGRGLKQGQLSYTLIHKTISQNTYSLPQCKIEMLK